ncbi:MAG: sulfite exporter TauE/SafE family protein [Candidatus Fimivivens sp.]|nr:sulfite exporter TauE/SafE family protein [Candidatus Fimivivens sp.]
MGTYKKTKKLRISGMTCVSCQNKIECKLRNTAGVTAATVSYSAGTVDVTYDTDIISLKNITDAIEKLDYKVLMENEHRPSNLRRTTVFLLLILSIYWLLEQFGLLNMLVPSQLGDTRMGYGMLFMIGLVTSVHCVAMCGGINLSQCIPRGESGAETQSRVATFMPTFLYNLGRVISYTVVGFLLGLFGMLIGGETSVGLPTMLQGILKLVAGVFMVIMGINMLGLFPWLQRFTPRMPRIFAQKVNAEKAPSHSPLIVGLLNGLMPCGPLQSMQIVALASANPFAGALSMFLFSLGTVPLMFGLGSIISALGKKFTSKVMTVGAVLVVVLGLAMLSQGLSLSGFSLSALSPNSQTQTPGAADNSAKLKDGVQAINSTLSPGRYPNITVQEGIPVRWVINAPEGSINGCNNSMLIREYGIEHTFKSGDNIIEFTPTKTGTFQYSCWMGMIRANITVTEKGAAVPIVDITNEPKPAGVTIPTDEVAVAKETADEYGNKIQEVTMTLTDKGFSPAIAVVQAGLDVKWNIVTSAENVILVPTYTAQLNLPESESSLYFFPSSDFDFSTGDNAFYGYIKVVDNITTADLQNIKVEVGKFKPMIWPPETFIAPSGGQSCH